MTGYFWHFTEYHIKNQRMTITTWLASTIMSNKNGSRVFANLHLFKKMLNAAVYFLWSLKLLITVKFL